MLATMGSCETWHMAADALETAVAYAGHMRTATRKSLLEFLGMSNM